jgi:hypothetical protein
MSDYFNDDSLSADKWTLGALTAGASYADEEIEVAEEGGRLQIKPRPGITGRSYYGYISKKLFVKLTVRQASRVSFGYA